MSHIIGLGSIRPTGVDMVYVQVSELVNETIFNLDRSLRSVVRKNPRAEWSHFLETLERDGFSMILQPRDNPVFIHSRPCPDGHPNSPVYGHLKLPHLN